jgi:rubrerythrin
MDTDAIVAHMLGAEGQTVIRNLETAYEEEMKSSAACKAYAARADEEGYHGIASLFRATARAEQIHANNHARILRHMGGLTDITVPEPRVDSTAENLNAALVDQKFEVDYLYPTFLMSAGPLFDSTAIRSFKQALEADKSHVQLYSNATSRVKDGGDEGWALARREFGVCGLRIRGTDGGLRELPCLQLLVGEVGSRGLRRAGWLPSLLSSG